jgi:hypothetical protein
MNLALEEMVERRRIRDMFATAAMQSLITRMDLSPTNDVTDSRLAALAFVAYTVADAMLKERAK